jgi:cyanophycinase
MGGSTDVDAAFEWWKPYVAGGDVVVLRTSGSDGYNDYLHSQIGGIDSVETLLVTSRSWADHEYVAWRVRHAEGIFLAGGDQSTYLASWKDTALEDALLAAYQRGAALGGTSAGCAVLGPFVFSADNGTVYSSEALADPYDPYVTLQRDFLELPLLASVITDTHFAARDRMGRLAAFMARVLQDGWAADVIGIGVDECTALCIGPTGAGEVLTQSSCSGQGGSVYLVHSAQAPTLCQAGQPLEYSGLAVHELSPGQTVTFPGATTAVAASPLSASGGALSPADPY